MSGAHSLSFLTEKKRTLAARNVRLLKCLCKYLLNFLLTFTQSHSYYCSPENTSDLRLLTVRVEEEEAHQDQKTRERAI